MDLRRMMDEGRILIANVSKGRLGEGNAHLLGALLVTGITQAALSREAPEDKRRVFHRFAEEFQNFATDSFASILSEARKYGLTLTLAHPVRLWQFRLVHFLPRRSRGRAASPCLTFCLVTH
jgi:hypothetical protein